MTKITQIFCEILESGSISKNKTNTANMENMDITIHVQTG